MSIYRLIRLAVKAIFRSGFRSVLTMLGIIIGVGAVITMLGIGEGARRNIRESIASMGSNMIFIRPGADNHGPGRSDDVKFTMNDLHALQNESSLLAALSPAVQKSGQVKAGSENCVTVLYGVLPSYIEIRRLSVKEGRMFTDAESVRGSKVCLLGKTAADKLFPSGDPVGQIIRFGSIPFEVVGILTPKGENSFGMDQDDLILAPFEAVQKRVLASAEIRQIFASAVSEEESPEAILEITSILRESRKLRDDQANDFSVRSQQELGSTLDSTSKLLTILLSSIAAVSLFVGGIGIMNIMFVSVTERTREIGLRMAVGARGKDILMQFLIEAIIISVTGGIIGMILGVGAALSVKLIAGWPVVVLPASIILSFGVCVVTGIFFGWYPALKASRLDPIEALRYE